MARVTGRAGREAFSPHSSLKEARVAQSVERILGKDEVTSSILVAGSTPPLQ